MPPKKTRARTARITATRKTLVSPPPAKIVNDTIDVDADIGPDGVPGAHPAVDSTNPLITPATPTLPLPNTNSATVMWRKMPRDHPEALGKGWFPFVQRSTAQTGTELVVLDIPFEGTVTLAYLKASPDGYDKLFDIHVTPEDVTKLEQLIRNTTQYSTNEFPSFNWNPIRGTKVEPILRFRGMQDKDKDFTSVWDARGIEEPGLYDVMNREVLDQSEVRLDSKVYVETIPEIYKNGFKKEMGLRLHLIAIGLMLSPPLVVQAEIPRENYVLTSPKKRGRNSVDETVKEEPVNRD